MLGGQSAGPFHESRLINAEKPIFGAICCQPKCGIPSISLLLPLPRHILSFFLCCSLSFFMCSLPLTITSLFSTRFFLSHYLSPFISSIFHVSSLSLQYSTLPYPSISAPLSLHWLVTVSDSYSPSPAASSSQSGRRWKWSGRVGGGRM